MDEYILKHFIDKFKLKGFSEFELERYKIFYKDRGEGSGFDFTVFEWVGSYGDAEVWNIDATTVEIIFQGMALFDGIRHLNIGSEVTNNLGYLNYPDLNELMIILVFFKNLERKFCGGIDK